MNQMQLISVIYMATWDSNKSHAKTQKSPHLQGLQRSNFNNVGRIVRLESFNSMPEECARYRFPEQSEIQRCGCGLPDQYPNESHDLDGVQATARAEIIYSDGRDQHVSTRIDFTEEWPETRSQLLLQAGARDTPEPRVGEVNRRQQD